MVLRRNTKKGTDKTVAVANVECDSHSPPCSDHYQTWLTCLHSWTSLSSCSGQPDDNNLVCMPTLRHLAPAPRRRQGPRKLWTFPISCQSLDGPGKYELSKPFSWKYLERQFNDRDNMNFEISKKQKADDW